MVRLLYDNDMKIELFLWHEMRPSEKFIVFEDEFFTVSFLRRFINSYTNVITLRRILAEFTPVNELSMLSDYKVIEQLAHLMVLGHIKLVIQKEPEYSWRGGSNSQGDETADSETQRRSSAGTGAGGGGRQSGTGSQSAAGTETQSTAEDEGQADESESSTSSEEDTNNWIEFRVIDDETEEPVSGLKVSIKLPTGEVSDYTTNASGVVRIDNLPAGTFDLEKIIDQEVFEVIRVE